MARTFQSTPPCGGDGPATTGDQRSPNFNPRPLAGATVPVVCEDLLMTFQSTPPCGGDGAGFPSMFPEPDFNPRPLAGATAHYALTTVDPPISIHAPLRGRRACYNRRSEIAEFQSTPPCGGDSLVLSL